MRKFIWIAAAALAGQAATANAGPLKPIATDVPNPASIKLPDLNVAASASDEADFDKYFYFHRPDTSFAEALKDVRECDGYARGLASPYGYSEVPAQYAGTMGGAIGGAIADLLISSIFGSAELRKARRANMRRCMNYKGYDRFGLPKDTWQQFHFEEGLRTVDEARRQERLAQQAKAASGPRPVGKVLGR